jgi:hypothetical protein
MPQPNRRAIRSFPAGLAAAMLCLGPAVAAEKLHVQTPAGFDKDVAINEKVKAECAVGDRVSYFVREYAKDISQWLASPTMNAGLGEMKK